MSQLRGGFFRDLAGEVDGPARQLEAELARIEGESVARGDYLSAHVAAERRRTLRRQLDSLAGGGGRGGLVLRAGEQSATGGSVAYDAATGSLQRWTHAGNSASWDVRVPAPGRYRVTLVYSATVGDTLRRNATTGVMEAQSAGGTVVFREATNLRRAANEQPATATLANTGGWDQFKEADIGSIALESSSATLVLEALEIGELGLMHLREVRLYPDDGAPDPEVGGQRFAALRDAHRSRLALSLEQSAEPFIRELEATRSPAAALAIARVRSEVGGADPGAAVSAAEGATEEAGDAPQDDDPGSWVQLAAPVLDADAAGNRADTFWLTSGETRTLVRLIGCDSPWPRYEDEVKEVQDRAAFGLSSDSLADIGRTAWRFSRLALSRSPFVVWTEGEKDSGGRLLVHVANARGLHSEQLVSRGLALAAPAPGSGTLPAPLAHRQAYRTGLGETLRAAEEKAAEARRGLWRER